MLVPLIFTFVLIFKTGGPNDIPLGRYIRETGLALPFVVLFFMSIWAFPLITALVAGGNLAGGSRKRPPETNPNPPPEPRPGYPPPAPAPAPPTPTLHPPIVNA